MSSTTCHDSRRRCAVASAALVLSLGCTAVPGGIDPDATARIVRVVDGDTIVVSLGHRDETIRLIGIDTPETLKPDTPVECFGEEASALTAGLLPVGSTVRLQRDAEARDDYGRLLAYVHRTSDGLFVNLHLVEEGAARPLSIAPNTAHAEAIATAARRAKEQRRGLWGACSASR